MEVELLTELVVAFTPPNFTVAPLLKLTPLMVTVVPPVVDPLVGLTELTCGG
jgi:hypothetical protein